MGGRDDAVEGAEEADDATGEDVQLPGDEHSAIPQGDRERAVQEGRSGPPLSEVGGSAAVLQPVGDLASVFDHQRGEERAEEQSDVGRVLWGVHGDCDDVRGSEEAGSREIEVEVQHEDGVLALRCEPEQRDRRQQLRPFEGDSDRHRVERTESGGVRLREADFESGATDRTSGDRHHDGDCEGDADERGGGLLV